MDRGEKARKKGEEETKKGEPVAGKGRKGRSKKERFVPSCLGFWGCFGCGAQTTLTHELFFLILSAFYFILARLLFIYFLARR